MLNAQCAEFSSSDTRFSRVPSKQKANLIYEWDIVTHYKSIAANHVSFGYGSMSLEQLTQLVAGCSSPYVADEYLCRSPTGQSPVS